MLSQPGYAYTENFADLSNWTFSTSPANGTFTAGTGSAAWRGNDITATGTVPDGVRITASTTVYQTGTSSGIYQQNQALVLLATGTTNNSTAVAMDLFLNFTGLNSGTLSFDWASINNFSGDRKSSLKIFYSTNGTVFTEIPAAAVLNITNNSPTSGRINFAALPAAFNNAATAQLRFYYYNGTGGSTGSRPKINIDNIQVTGVPANVCATPAAQATSLNLTPAFSSISGSFTAASPAADGYIVVRSLNNSLSSLPVDGINYNVGDDLGDGNVISFGSSTSFNTASLSSNTQYYFFVFAMNNLCSGGTKYFTASPLIANASTLSGSSPCTAPAAQPASLSFSNITSTSIKGSFTVSPSPNADHYLVVRSTSSTLASNPVNGNNYSAGASLGGGTVVTKTQQATFTANNLSSGVTYYFFVFAMSEDNCTSGPAYNTTSPLTGSAQTTTVPVCATPAAQPADLNLSATNNTVNGYFSPVTSADGYLVVRGMSPTLTAAPQNGIHYSIGTSLGNGTVISNGTATSFVAVNLSSSTTYYFFVFAKQDQCTGGPVYRTSDVTSGSAATTATAPLNYYYGNLHSHTSFSDGNKDNTSLTPVDAYAYAKNSLCMDFLGISEHNHSEAGMQLADYSTGQTAATNATTANFLGLYGMEWGVISNGGHVLVYGINQLLGWEAGNYNLFVAKNDYLGKPPTTGTTGLFKTINDWPSTAFAMLAHPDNSDFGSIVNNAVNATADSAVVGVALESGPAFSTSTSYNDIPSRLSHYSYYKRLLSRGYHVGPSIDHDNHYTNFGRTNYSRLAVMSPNLTQPAFLQSVKDMRFYATHDCDVRVSFVLNNMQMGSSATGTTPPAMSVYVYDPTNPSATPVIRILQGITGSGLIPVVIDSITGSNTFNFTDFNLPVNTNAYYFAEISISGGYAISSPIWYTKTSGIVPVTLLSFKANVTNNRTVSLDWRTVNESNNRVFIVERSADGLNFKAIDSVAAKNLLSENMYAAEDKKPFAGLNYYRLKQLDNDGKFSYSKIQTAYLTSSFQGEVKLYPNPVRAKLFVEINAVKETKGEVSIVDALGRNIRTVQYAFTKGIQVKELNVSDLGNGTYFVVVRIGDEKVIRRFVKQ